MSSYSLPTASNSEPRTPFQPRSESENDNKNKAFFEVENEVGVEDEDEDDNDNPPGKCLQAFFSPY